MVPRTPKDRRAFALVIVCLVFAVAFVASFALLQRHYQEVREATWRSATGVITDARPKLVAQGMSQGGGAMLYQVEVRVAYTSDEANDRWITVSHRPTVLDAAQFDIFRWKGQHCIVRWKPSDPTHPIAEVS